jgi:protein-disulfide isomerase
MDNNSSTNSPDQNVSSLTAPSDNSEAKKQSRILFVFLFIGLLLAAVIVLVILHINHQPKSESDSSSAQTEAKEKEPTPEEIKKVNDELATENPNFYETIIKANKANGQIGDHVRGKADSSVVVIEYADFQCPGCATMMPYMTSIYEEYKDNVAFVFRNYPISSHVNAKPAARAAEAAGLQGYFWEMTEALYSKRTDWIGNSGGELNQSLANIFKSVAPSGDLQKFKSDYLSAQVNTKITYDYSLGHDKARIPGTPSIFVNGILIDGDYETIDDLANGIRSEINRQLAK